MPNAAYGPSKAVLPWYALRIAAEDPWLACLVLDPGHSQTDMGNAGAREFGRAAAPLPVDVAVDGLFRVLAAAPTREDYGGRVVRYTGEIQEW